jgi:hypothetical protein
MGAAAGLRAVDVPEAGLLVAEIKKCPFVRVRAGLPSTDTGLK